MSKTDSRPADQPNHRRTARKVSRASSSPGQHRDPLAGPLVRPRPSTSSELPASRTADVANASMSSLPLSSATAERLGGERGERVDPLLGHGSRVVEVLGEAQRLLVGVRRQRRGTAVGVDHQQVPGVGPDVEDAQPHGSNGTSGLSPCT